MINQIGGSTSAAQSTPTPPGGKLGKDEFLKMLVAQMRNQDPLNPQDGQEMAVQLAQFSSVEQLANMSKGLENLTAVLGGEMMHSLHANSAMGVLGRTVLARGDQVEIGGSQAPSITVDVAGMGGGATLRIFDEQGREVGSRKVGSVPGGRHTLELGDAAKGLPAGVYRYQLDVVNAAGEAVNTIPYVRAQIDGVRYGTNGPILTSGGLSLPFAAVIEIGTK